ncbi:DUF2007 domain-containing protein [Flammeovirga yaeyamensis]|uniref:DUF2007 domain-containing protein n=1 Tax=Flammeovirga yaeyamensis TaxID=367791 RepID=A0AAX1N4P9_9BACT|nr:MULTISPECIES: DUF2007 domain-containing protein [Flammeovirga]ANQ50077.1 DUF2007 domain-containing protein [Flammeovirga sp. MY04]MBB3700403.1 hypothetical protein [Flammeovirga yaeyamensis]NMF36971.1 DUF2007 domain-containing protein [Flammeovirga yaeyamensis]QWG02485.1 DUF2007 domain-containing protein [Flammeovirga yaeyamensis]
MSKWVKVYSTDQVYKAEIVKSTLEDRGVPAVILDKRDSSYNDFGLREVMVDESKKEEAETIIKQDVELK